MKAQRGGKRKWIARPPSLSQLQKWREFITILFHFFFLSLGLLGSKAKQNSIEDASVRVCVHFWAVQCAVLSLQSTE